MTLSLLDRMTLLEQDLAAFKRAHAAHKHPVENGGRTIGVARPPYESAAPSSSFAARLAPTPGVVPTWQTLEDAQAERYGAITDLRANAENRAWAAITEWMAKAGTSRLDALAHLAAWCTEDMHKDTNSDKVDE